MANNFLFIEKDQQSDEQLKFYLQKESFNIISHNNEENILDMIESYSIDIVILLNDNGNFEFNKIILDIRKKYLMPIIIISGTSDITEKVLCLEMGANDYIVRPYNPLEAISRINSILIWYHTLINSSNVTFPNVLKIGGLALNVDTKKVTRDGEDIDLTPIGFKILYLMMSNPNKVFSIDEIFEKVWNEASFNANNTVAVHFRRLRQKIELDPSNPKYLKSVWGLGYKLSTV